MTMNNNQLPLVTYEQARRLKKAGFDWSVIKFFDDDGNDYETPTAECLSRCVISPIPRYSAPTVALALKWVRDTKPLCYSLAIVAHGHYFRAIKAEIDGCVVRPSEAIKLTKTYEEAESALLDGLLALLETPK